MARLRIARTVSLVAVVASFAFASAATADARASEVDSLSSKEADAEVFMELNADKVQIDRVRRALLSSAGVRHVAFVDQDGAYEEFKRIFRDKPKLVASIRPRDLPTSFRVDTRSHQAADGLVRSAADLPGVDDAITTYPWSMARTIVAIADCRLRGDSSFEVFMDLDATSEQLQVVERAVERQPNVEAVKVLSQDDAYSEFVEIFASQPEQAASVTPEDLPTSIRVRADSLPSPSLLDRLEALPGVDSVGTNSGMCEDIFRLLAKGLTDRQVARTYIEQRWGSAT